MSLHCIKWKIPSLNQIRARWSCCLIRIIWIQFIRLLSTCARIFPKLAFVHFRILSQSVFPTSHDHFNISNTWTFLPYCQFGFAVCCNAHRDKKNADGSIFCVCHANLCVTNPSGTADRRCDKNSYSLNVLKRKKYQNVANKRNRNS